MAEAKKAPKRRKDTGKTSGQRRKRTPARKTDTRPWGIWAAAVILAVAALRLVINSAELVPIHFDEAQYWAYGQELAWGHFSKPPLVGWLLTLAGWVAGPSAATLRAISVICHAGIAAMLFLLGQRLWDRRTGFFAAIGYTAAPGVTASAMLVTTDPVLMLFWAVALYAWVRAANEGARSWWAIMGAALGLSILAKYTGIAFAAGALGYGLFSARERDWRGSAIAAGVAFLIVLPNLFWLAAHNFATIGHIAEDAAPPGSRYNIGALAEFFGAQFGVIGPVWFAAILAALWWRRRWIDDWRMRMLAWQTFALLGAMVALAFWTRAQPNWAAPAYVAGSLLAARIVLAHDWRRALPAQAAIGGFVAMVLYGLTFAYSAMGPELPRAMDPFKKMRIGETFCAIALGHGAEEGAEVLLSDDRRRLSECMFYGGLGWDDIAVWNPRLIPDNHHELVATLRPGDQRVMMLATTSPRLASEIARHFEDAVQIETGHVQTHVDRGFDYAIWRVQGFRGY